MALEAFVPYCRRLSKQCSELAAEEVQHLELYATKAAQMAVDGNMQVAVVCILNAIYITPHEDDTTEGKIESMEGAVEAVQEANLANFPQVLLKYADKAIASMKAVLKQEQEAKKGTKAKAKAKAKR